MKNYVSRIWVILVVTALGLWYMLPPGERLKRGIDLKGGTILVYQIDVPQGQSVDMEKMIAAVGKRINPAGLLDVTIRPLGSERLEIILPEATPEDAERVQKKITQLGQLEFRILATEERDRSAVHDAIEKRKRREPPPAKYEWVKIQKPSELGAHGGVVIMDDSVLTVIPDEHMRVTGDDLTRSEPTEQDFQRVVSFTFNSRGATRFARLTREYKPRQDGFKYRLAILLDRQVISAPDIRTPIEGGQGIIEMGQGDPEQVAREVDDLVDVLNAGKLPAMLVPTPYSKDTISATLGEDTIRKGSRAIVISMIAVPLFMLIYYLFSGLVADLALLVNLILILGFMGATGSTFTLPGLAGLALTIGMAVDANVLIFERIREEREKGAALTQAIRAGFDRAWLAIFDSNLTTILTGMILYWLGTDQIKGFALTLMIGLATNLFTAVFASRAIFEIWARRGWISDLKMMHLIRSPSLDYVTPRYYFMTGSAVVIAIGLVAAAVRGSEILDIDFTGGTAMSVRVTPESAAQHGERLTDFVRSTASEVLPNVKVERLKSEQAAEEQRGALFLVRTTEADQNRVKEAILSQFRDKLGVLATVKIASWEPVAAAPGDSKDGTEEKTDTPANNEAEDKASTPEPATKQKVRLTLNQPVSVDALTQKVEQALRDMKVAQPELQYQLVATEGSDVQLTETFFLETTQDIESLVAATNRQLEQSPVFERENNFGSQVAGETRTKAILAMLLSWVVIVAYLAFRFKNWSYGFAAVVALVHDVLIAFGFVAIGGWLASVTPGLAGLLLIDDFKIDLTVVSAFMTIIGFSVNDTIVIFDRIREIRGKSPAVTAHMINSAVNQCMSRTLITSLTVLVVLLIMYAAGGPGIHAFSFAMFVGCIAGIYSTIFIASPILILFAGQPRSTAAQRGLQYESAAASA